MNRYGEKKVSEFYVDYETFKLGLYALEDTTKAPFGTARVMRNMRVSDSGSIAPRLGTSLLGTFNSASKGVRGLYNFRKAFDQDEFLIKTYDTYMEVYSKNHSAAAAANWFAIQTAFLSDKEFGFVTSLVNTENQDYCIFCNRYDPYQRWSGSVTLLRAALAGGETTIPVDSTLTEEVFEDGTAVANSATTLDVAGTPWAASQWVNMYVRITSGAQTGQVRLISANTSSQITFAAMTAPGNCTFEIRQLAFPASGVLIINGTNVAYSAISTDSTITSSAAPAAPDNSAVALVPELFLAAPRGNRLTNYLGRIIVGNVRSALARNTGGALQGYASGGSYFVSKINNPVDFSFTATRIAGEGDIISTPYGGGEITDVSLHEDTAYVFKPRYIEAVQYSQDANDLANRTPLKAEIGARVPVIKGSDDIYFITQDNKFTSIGRVKQQDILPHTLNIGSSIKRLLDAYVFDFGRGIEDQDNIYIPAKSSADETNNDIVIVYNKTNKSFDGIWELHANFFAKFDEELYFGESNTPNIYQMNVGHADITDGTRFPISSEYATHFMNLTGSAASSQALSSLYFEGYIQGGTEITFKAWKDLSTTPFLSFVFSGNEEQFLSGGTFQAFLGGNPIALRPMGSISEPGADGRRHFFFRVYFPFVYGNHFSIGFSSEGADLDYEVSRFGLGLAEEATVDTTTIKTI